MVKNIHNSFVWMLLCCSSYRCVHFFVNLCGLVAASGMMTALHLIKSHRPIAEGWITQGSEKEVINKV